MNQLKAGTFLIVLGNLLYLVFTFFSGNETSNFAYFSKDKIKTLENKVYSKLIIINFIGIILLVAYMSKNNKDKVEKN